MQSFLNIPNKTSDGGERLQELLGDDDMEVLDRGETELREAVGGRLVAESEQSLRANLRDLRALRGRLDGAITSLESALSIMGDESSSTI